MDHYEKVRQTALRIKKLVDESTEIMIQKNQERTDAWKGTGLIGQLVEIYSMYMRLKVLVWDMNPIAAESYMYVEWKEDVRNALVDLRNFTVLGELCLDDDNILGDEEIMKIICKDCGGDYELQRIQKREDN
jgi:hypothetical protein